MGDDAEKLINLSLCKMAESRTIRRGGTSLHKHLLISTVLTKARSAYFETWYMGDSDVTDPRSGRTVDLNSSYQELEFPLDDDDDDEEDEDDDEEGEQAGEPFLEPGASSSYYPSEELPSSQSSLERHDTDQNIHDKNFDPRFFVEVETGDGGESEIELPSDILKCVEKMGDYSDMSFGVDENDSASAPTPPTSPASSDMVDSDNPLLVRDVDSSSKSNEKENVSQSTHLTYLDLDSSTSSLQSHATKEGSEDDSDNSNEEDEGVAFGSPRCTSTPNPTNSKRPRSWSLEELSDDEDGNECFRSGQTSCFVQEFSKVLRCNALSITNIAKRLRFSPEEVDPNLSSPPSAEESEETKAKSAKPFPHIVDREFRTKKGFEEDEQDDSDDDPFLGDALGQSSKGEQLAPRRKNDQRVPSASNGSSSDEDADADQPEGDYVNCMEVDQITNLVQIISFSKHQSQSTLQRISASSVSSTSGPAANHWPKVYS